MRAIETLSDMEAALALLVASDPRLASVAAIAGPVALRRRPGGFEGLAAIVTAQQISTVAAESIWRRLKAAVDPFTPRMLLATPEATLKEAGLSRAKIRTLTGLATAADQDLDLDAIHQFAAEDAISAITALSGVGPWTAEIYLLFCVGHPDIFPAGDLALRNAVHDGLRLRERPDERGLRKLAERWAPWRGAAAHLFWAYYRVRRQTLKKPAKKAA